MLNRTTKKVLAVAMALTFVLSNAVASPVVASAATKKTVTVKTQKQLDAALKDKKVTSIVIKTSKNVTLKIKDGDYGKKTLTVTSPKATINNYGDFKKISVNDGKSFTDRGEGNNILVKDKNSLKLVTGKQSSDTKITVSTSAKGGKINIVNNGSVDAIKINGKSTVTVGGNSKDAPTITNSATGAKIVASMDANIVLDKKATLSVKEGVTLESLTVNANANITVAKGAAVEKVVVAGNASDVALNVNGTVANVTVDTKADVAVSGSTTQTVAITNNAEGATIKSEVKTDVTLNADAKINLDKGAEGSSVTAGNENVKTDVTNNTSEKVTVTDSNGKDTTVESGKSETTTPDTKPSDTKPSDSNTSGGGGGGSSSSGSSSGGSSSSGSGGQQTPKVTVTPVIKVHGAVVTSDTKVYLDNELTAEASSSDNANHEYSYKWYVGNEVVGTGAVYHVREEALGKSIKLVASTTINSSTVSGDVSTRAVMIPIFAPRDGDDLEVCVSFEATEEDVLAELGSDAMVFDYFGNKVTSAKITWSAPEGFTSTVAGTYVFTGKISADLEKYYWYSDDQADTERTVRVLGQNLAQFSMSLATDDELAGSNNNKISGVAQVEDSIWYEIRGNHLVLDECAPNGLSLGKYIAVDVDFGEDVSGQVKFGYTAELLDIVNAVSGSPAVTTATNSAIRVYVDVEEAYYDTVTYYVKVGDGDITPIRFCIESENVVAGDLKTDLSSFEGKHFKLSNFSISELPSSLTYDIVGYDKTADVKVHWNWNKNYWESAGEYTFTAQMVSGEPITITSMPSITVVLDKNDHTGMDSEEIEDVVLHAGGSSVYFKAVKGYEYTVVKNIEELANATWKSNVDCITGLNSHTEYWLAYRLAATATETEYNYRTSRFMTTEACYKPTGTSVTSGAISTTISEGVNDLLDEFTYMLKADGKSDDSYLVGLNWTSVPEYNGEVGTYVFTASPVGDYRDIFDFSNVKWPVRKITVSEDEIVDPDPDPVKSLSGSFGVFGDTRIGIIGNEGAIETEVSDGVVTLKPALSLNPVDDVYMLPIDVELNDDTYSIEKLSVTDANGDEAGFITPFRHEGIHLQFWVTLDKNADDKVGAAFYMDYDGEGTKYLESDLIKIDTTGITFLPAASVPPVVVTTPSAIEGLEVYPMKSTINTEKDYKIVKNSDGTSYSVTATLNYKDMNGFEGLDGEYSKGYFIPLRFTVPETVNASNVSLAVTGGAVSALIYTTNSEEHTIELFIRSCKDQATPCAISVDFDGEGTAWAPYVFTINEDNVVLDASDGDPADLSIVSELPEGVNLARAENVCGCLTTRYADGTVTIDGDMQMDITSGNDKVQFFMKMSKGDNVGVAIGTANGIAYHVFDQGSNTVAVQDNDVWISRVIELNNSGELSPDNQGAFTIYTLEAGPNGTYTLAKEYNITVDSTVTVSGPEYIE